MTNKTTRKSSLTAKEAGEPWSLYAQWIGYNELARKSEKLGEKVFFRFVRAAVEVELVAAGLKIEITRDPVILTLDAKRPWIELTQADIELMRKCVAEHDAALPSPNPTEPSEGGR
ncbi:MAG: hypothetical protein ABFD89_17505 [Bryobacteraceae bacterium]